MEQKIIPLQPRLQLLSELVPLGVRLIDVGTDHGYLPVRLLQEGRISRALACDIGVEPLEHAKRTAAQYGIESNLEFRLCDGLQGIALTERDAVVIAGMGGETICHILGAAPETGNGCLLLLQPMTKVEQLRIWLTERDYTIRREHLVWDKNYLYPVLEAAAGHREPLSILEQYGGVNLSADPLYLTYLEQKTQKLNRAIFGLQRGSGENSEKLHRLQEICRILEKEKESLL